MRKTGFEVINQQERLMREFRDEIPDLGCGAADRVDDFERAVQEMEDQGVDLSEMEPQDILDWIDNSW